MVDPRLGEITLTPWSEFRQIVSHVTWLVDGLLPSEGSSILVAQPKVGKTTLTYHLAQCIAEGRPFLGREVDQGPVVMLLSEGSASMHLEAMTAMRVRSDAPIHLCTDSLRAGVHAVERALDKLHSVPKLVVFDTLFKLVRPPDGNEYGKMVPAMEQVTDLAKSRGTHVLCTHHANKALAEAGISSGNALGSTAISGAVDSILMLSKRGKRRTISSDQRWGENMEETVWTYNSSEGEVLLGEKAKVIRSEVIEERIIEALYKGPKTEVEVRTVVTDREVPKLLRKLLTDGIIKKCGLGVKGNPCLYQLADL